MFYYMVCWLFVLLFLVFLEFRGELLFTTDLIVPEEPEKTDTFQKYLIEVDYLERPPPVI